MKTAKTETADTIAAPKKTAKTPKGKTVKRILEFPLTEKEFKTFALEAAAKAVEVGELNTEFEGVKEIWKARIKNAEAARDVALEQITKGTADKEVECTEVKNFEKKTVEYWFKGAVMKTREMTETDRQTDLPLKHGKTPKAPTAAMRKAEGAEPKALDKKTAADLDIAAVHREETSKKGSWSVANGAR